MTKAARRIRGEESKITGLLPRFVPEGIPEKKPRRRISSSPRVDVFEEFLRGGTFAIFQAPSCPAFFVDFAW